MFVRSKDKGIAGYMVDGCVQGFDEFDTRVILQMSDNDFNILNELNDIICNKERWGELFDEMLSVKSHTAKVIEIRERFDKYLSNKGVKQKNYMIDLLDWMFIDSLCDKLW